MEKIEVEALTIKDLTAILNKSFINDEEIPQEYCGTSEYIKELAIEIHLRLELVKNTVSMGEDKAKILRKIKDELQIINQTAGSLYSFIKVLQIASTNKEDKIIIEYLEFMEGIKTKIKALRNGINEHIEELTSEIWESEENEKAES